MATHIQLRRSVDESLKTVRLKSSELRQLLWREGATADPKVLMYGMDYMFESIVELENLLHRERLAGRFPPHETKEDPKK